MAGMDAVRGMDEGAEVEAPQPAALPRVWNHNIAYHRFVRRAVPAGSIDLLDVGCGRGRLARELSGPGRRVLGLDPSADMIDAARAEHAGVPGLEFAQGDFLARHFPPGSFDFVCFVASLHHMDQVGALAKAADVLRPGGRIVVVGLARSTTRSEKLVSALCAPIVLFNDLRPEFRGIDTPLVDPALGWRETEKLATGALPGAGFRRRPYFRYTLSWTKPRH